MPGCWVDNAIRYRGVKSELITLMNSHMLTPYNCRGTVNDIALIEGYEWCKRWANSQTYFALFQGWTCEDLPIGYNIYIVSFHLEVVPVDWIIRQATRVDAKIILLSDNKYYDFKFPDNVQAYTYFYWHKQLARMIEWHGIQDQLFKTYKFSAVNNRITQSKIWITTKLLECARQQSLIVLSDWLEERNVHYWQATENQTLDSLTSIFKEKYLGQLIKVDTFDNSSMNIQRVTSNPWQPLYTETALHFTNESFHYSGKIDYVHPGPFITEKTLKCLLAATAMIPVGQFDTYATLSNMGLCFDYPFDTTWDSDVGDLTRFEKIIELIDHLNQYTAQELANMTREINLYNQNYILSGKFYENCEKHNNYVIEQIIDNNFGLVYN